MLELATRSLRPNNLFALHYVHDGRLSPNGRSVAYLTSRTTEETGEELFELWIEELESGIRHRLNFANRVHSPRWSPDGTRLAFIGSDSNAHRLYVADAIGQNCVALTPEQLLVSGPPAWSPDGSSIAYTVVIAREIGASRRITERIFRSEAIGFIDHLRQTLQIVDVRSRSIRSLELRQSNALQPEFSPCGKRLLFLGTETAVGYLSFEGAQLFTVELDSEQTTPIVDHQWAVSAATWSPCGERIVIIGDRDRLVTSPLPSLWIVNRDGSHLQCRTDGVTGTIGFRIHHDMPTWATSPSNPCVVPSSTHAFATIVKEGCTEIWRIALEGPIRCEPVVTGARSCVLLDAQAATSQILYAVSDIHTPWDLYLSNADGGNERRLTNLNQAVLSTWPALRVQHLRFESTDGLPLEGWFLARADREGPQPTVMFIHAGPFLATGHVFRFDLHLLAANGYAVVCANFRGSAGYGIPFARAIMGDWGARGFPDHMAAVDTAISRGLADPNRLGVWGASHGGFATAWIVGHTTRFRAAVVESAMSNFSTAYYLGDAPDWIVHDLGGRPDEIPDVYRSRSSLTYAWRCQTPTLMLHGEEDLRCPASEAEQFYRALHDVGCTTELVLISGMTHMGDSTGPLAARKGQNEALLDWFERYL